MIVLDASVLVAYLDDEHVHHERAVGALDTDDDLALSTVTLAEVLVAPARLGQVDVVLQVLQDLQVDEVPLPEDAAVRLAHLRAETGVKLPDCCVLLATQPDSRMATLDRRLRLAAEGLGLEVVDV